MIPKEVIDVTNGDYIAYLGSRNEELTPSMRMVWGISFQAAENIVTGFVIKDQYEPMLQNYQANGRVALAYSDSNTHLAYQLKGRFLQARPLSQAERDLQRQYQADVKQALMDMGYPETLASKVINPADLAIDIQVETIFNQTPGPGAGKAIAF